MALRVYSDPRWRKLRAAQLKREPLCKLCLQMGRQTQATVADRRGWG